jgi:hypothetical protein
MAENGVVDAAVTPFPPPPKFYEDFEPHAAADFKMPAPPKPIEGPYVMFGTMYDTTFGPQHPSTALEAYRIKVSPRQELHGRGSGADERRGTARPASCWDLVSRPSPLD